MMDGEQLELKKETRSSGIHARYLGHRSTISYPHASKKGNNRKFYCYGKMSSIGRERERNCSSLERVKFFLPEKCLRRHFQDFSFFPSFQKKGREMTRGKDWNERERERERDCEPLELLEIDLRMGSISKGK